MSSALQSLDDYVMKIEGMKEHLKAVRSPVALENASRRIQNVDADEDFYSDLAKTHEETSTQFEQQMEEIRDAFLNSELSSSPTVDRRILEEWMAEMDTLQDKANHAKQESKQEFAEFHCCVHEKVNFCFCLAIKVSWRRQVNHWKEILLESIPSHASEIRLLKTRDALLSQEQSRLDQNAQSIKSKIQNLKRKVRDLKELTKVGQLSRKKSTDISKTAESKTSVWKRRSADWTTRC